MRRVWISITSLAFVVSACGVVTQIDASEQPEQRSKQTWVEETPSTHEVSYGNPYEVNGLVAWTTGVANFFKEAAYYQQGTLNEEAERQRLLQQQSVPSSSGAVGGSGGGCGVPPDTGEPLPIPGYVIQRESGGDVNASNGSHFGRAQVSCQHYGTNGGCVGLTYAQCVTQLWDGGAGSSNWAQTI